MNCFEASMPMTCRAVPRQLEGTAAHRASQIQRPRAPAGSRRASRHSATQRAGKAGGHGVRVAVMQITDIPPPPARCHNNSPPSVFPLRGQQSPQISRRLIILDHDFRPRPSRSIRACGHANFRRFGRAKTGCRHAWRFSRWQICPASSGRPDDRCAPWRRAGCRGFFHPGCRGPTAAVPACQNPAPRFRR